MTIKSKVKICKMLINTDNAAETRAEISKTKRTLKVSERRTLKAIRKGLEGA